MPGKLLHDRIPPFSAGQLVADDFPDLPVQAEQGSIGGLRCLLAGRLDELHHSVESGVGWGRGGLSCESPAGQDRVGKDESSMDMVISMHEAQTILARKNEAFWVFLPNPTNRTIPEFRCIFEWLRTERPDQHPVNRLSKSILCDTRHLMCFILCLIIGISDHLKPK